MLLRMVSLLRVLVLIVALLLSSMCRLSGLWRRRMLSLVLSLRARVRKSVMRLLISILSLLSLRIL